MFRKDHILKDNSIEGNCIPDQLNSIRHREDTRSQMKFKGLKGVRKVMFHPVNIKPYPVV